MSPTDWQEGAARTRERSRDIKGQRLATGASQTAARLVRGVTRRSGSSDAAARGGRLDAPLRQSGRRRNGRVPRHRRPMSSRECASATSPIRISRHRCAASRSGAQGGVLRAALQPAAGRADGGLRAGRRGQSNARPIRASRVSEEIPQQQNSPRRQVSRARRAGHSSVVAADPGLGRPICCRRFSRSTTTCAG